MGDADTTTPAPEAAQFADFSLRPFRYAESNDEGGLTIALQATLTAAETERLRKLQVDEGRAYRPPPLRFSVAPLTQEATHECVQQAQRFLALAHGSAQEALTATDTLRAARRAKTGRAASGKTSAQDQDLLRAMLVFACAGLDASMKTLIRDALPTLTDHHAEVSSRLKDFTVQFLSSGSGVSTKSLAMILNHSLHSDRSICPRPYWRKPPISRRA